MTSYWYLALMVVLVVVGIAAGVLGALGLNQLTGGAAFEFGKGVGTIVTFFGSCTLGVVVMYYLGTILERQISKRQRRPDPKTYDQKARVQRKTRQKK